MNPKWIISILLTVTGTLILLGVANITGTVQANTGRITELEKKFSSIETKLDFVVEKLREKSNCGPNKN